MFEAVAETVLSGVLFLFSVHMWACYKKDRKRDSVIKAIADHVGFDLEKVEDTL